MVEENQLLKSALTHSYTHIMSVCVLPYTHTMSVCVLSYTYTHTISVCVLSYTCTHTVCMCPHIYTCTKLVNIKKSISLCTGQKLWQNLELRFLYDVSCNCLLQFILLWGKVYNLELLLHKVPHRNNLPPKPTPIHPKSKKDHSNFLWKSWP